MYIVHLSIALPTTAELLLCSWSVWTSWMDLYNGPVCLDIRCIEFYFLSLAVLIPLSSSLVRGYVV